MAFEPELEPQGPIEQRPYGDAFARLRRRGIAPDDAIKAIEVEGESNRQAELPNLLGRSLGAGLGAGIESVKRGLSEGIFRRPLRGEDIFTGLGTAALNTLGGIASPFTGLAAAGNTASVLADPRLRAEHERILSGLDPKVAADPATHAAVARAISDSETRRLLGVRDSAAGEEEKLAADTLAFLRIGQRVAEFGGPQLLRSGARSLGGAIERAEAQRLAQRPVVMGGYSPTGQPAVSIEYPGGIPPEMVGRVREPGIYTKASTPALASGRAKPVQPTFEEGIFSELSSAGGQALPALSRTKATKLGRVTGMPPSQLERRGLPAIAGAEESSGMFIEDYYDESGNLTDSGLREAIRDHGVDDVINGMLNEGWSTTDVIYDIANAQGLNETEVTNLEAAVAQAAGYELEPSATSVRDNLSRLESSEIPRVQMQTGPGIMGPPGTYWIGPPGAILIQPDQWRFRGALGNFAEGDIVRIQDDVGIVSQDSGGNVGIRWVDPDGTEQFRIMDSNTPVGGHQLPSGPPVRRTVFPAGEIQRVLNPVENTNRMMQEEQARAERLAVANPQRLLRRMAGDVAAGAEESSYIIQRDGTIEVLDPNGWDISGIPLRYDGETFQISWSRDRTYSSAQLDQMRAIIDARSPNPIVGYELDTGREHDLRRGRAIEDLIREERNDGAVAQVTPQNTWQDSTGNTWRRNTNGTWTGRIPTGETQTLSDIDFRTFQRYESQSGKAQAISSENAPQPREPVWVDPVVGDVWRGAADGSWKSQSTGGAFWRPGNKLSAQEFAAYQQEQKHIADIATRVGERPSDKNLLQYLGRDQPSESGFSVDRDVEAWQRMPQDQLFNKREVVAVHKSRNTQFGVVENKIDSRQVFVVAKGNGYSDWTVIGQYFDVGPGHTVYGLHSSMQGLGAGKVGLVGAQRLLGRATSGITYTQAGFANRIAAHLLDVKERTLEELGFPDRFLTSKLRSLDVIGPTDVARLKSYLTIPEHVLAFYPDVRKAMRAAEMDPATEEKLAKIGFVSGAEFAAKGTVKVNPEILKQFLIASEGSSTTEFALMGIPALLKRAAPRIMAFLRGEESVLLPSASGAIRASAGPAPAMLGRESVVGTRVAGRGILGSQPGGDIPTFGSEQFPAEIQDALFKMQEATEPLIEGARPVISFAGQAAPSGKPIWELASAVPRPGDVSLPAMELRQRVASLLQETEVYRQKVDDGSITPEETARYANLMRMAALGRAAEVGAVSESARTLGGVRASINITDAAKITTRAIDELLTEVAQNDPKKLDQLATALSTMGNDPRKISALMSQVAHKADFWDKFDEYYRANVLWNPATHFTNTFSGLFQQALLGTKVLSGLPGDVARYGPIGFRPTMELIRGWGRGYVEAMNMFPDAMSGSLNSSDKFGGVQRGGAIGPGDFWGLGRWYGPIVRTPFRFLGAADLFQTMPMYNGLLAREAYRQALKEGLRGSAADARVEQLIQEKPANISDAAFAQAEEFALHGQSSVAKALGDLRRQVPVLRPMVLFINTPVNLIALSARHSPLGLLRLLKSSGREQWQDVLQEVAVGSAITAGFAFMLADDNATGLSPKSKGEAAAWQSEGRAPLSIRASEYPMLGPIFRAIWGEGAKKRWMGPQLLGPLLMPYLVAASAHEAFRKENPDPLENRAIVAAANAGRTMLDQLPLFSTYSLVSRAVDVTNPDAAFRLAAQLAVPIIPQETLLATVARLTDGWRRDAKTFDEIFRTKIPFASTTVRPRLDVLGRPQLEGGWPGGILPRSTIEDVDPVITESEKLRKNVPEHWSGLQYVDRTIGQKELSYDEHQRYKELAGEERRKRLISLITSPDYQRSGPMERARLFQRTDNDAKAEGRRRLGLEMVTAAGTTEAIRDGIQVSWSGARGNYEKGLVLRDVQNSGKLKPDVVAQLDKDRDQPDPSRKNYDLSASDYLRGVELRQRWESAPAFTIGTPEEWSAAQRAAEDYRLARSDLERSARTQGIPVQRMGDYQQLLKMYQNGGMLNGASQLVRFYTPGGSPRDGLISAERQSIEQDWLWGHFKPHS